MMAKTGCNFVNIFDVILARNKRANLELNETFVARNLSDSVVCARLLDWRSLRSSQI